MGVMIGLVCLPYLAVQIHHRLSKSSEADGVREAYRRGEITLDEMERRLDLLMDDEAARIREVVEPISGIGDDTSWSIAERYDSVNDLRRADVDELEDVPNVGEKRARAIQERLSK